MSVKAAVMVAPGAPIETWSLPDPEIHAGGVLLETIASEVCGTDVHLYKGKLAGVPYPIIPGHVSVGKIIESFKIDKDAIGRPIGKGDLVTFLDVHEVCGSCYHCLLKNQPNRCPSRKVYGITYGVQDGLFGGWAEHIYLQPGVHILKLPEGLTAEDVIGGGCGLFTGFAAVGRSELTMGDTVVIQGCGPVGLSAAAFANLRGAGRVILIGEPKNRLALGEKLGADVILDLGTLDQESLFKEVKSLTAGRGADVVIEASGNPVAVSQGLEMIRDGGTYVVAGHYTDAGEIQVNPHLDINKKHVAIKGQWGTEFHHLVGALQLLAKHSERLPFASVIGSRYTLDTAGEALKNVESLKDTKAIIQP
jgi:threonine dehydrogenase-like Zn-dependent dehydrogenase